MTNQRTYLNLFVLFLFILNKCICFAQEKTMEEIYQDIDSRRTMPIHYRNVYEISKGIFSCYPIRFIQLDNSIMLADNGYHDFLITEIDDTTKLNSKEILKRDDAFILETELRFAWGLSYMTFSELYQFEKLIPENCTTDPKNISVTRHDKINNLTRITYTKSPYGYLLVLITGKAYNDMTYNNWSDGLKSYPLEFPDKYAYYRLLIPVWKADED